MRNARPIDSHYCYLHCFPQIGSVDTRAGLVEILEPPNPLVLLVVANLCPTNHHVFLDLGTLKRLRVLVAFVQRRGAYVSEEGLHPPDIIPVLPKNGKHSFHDAQSQCADTSDSQPRDLVAK